MASVWVAGVMKRGRWQSSYLIAIVSYACFTILLSVGTSCRSMCLQGCRLIETGGKCCIHSQVVSILNFLVSSTITLLFQDSRGGLELKDAETGAYLHAEPEEDAFVVNVGDMLQRFSNGMFNVFAENIPVKGLILTIKLLADYFISALHQVTVPDLAEVPNSGLPTRYSIPFFVAPDFSHTISTPSHFISETRPKKYEPVRFDRYGELISKYQYQPEN